MEDRTPLGSQEARLSSRPPSIDRENPVSSPVLPSPGIQNGSKPRKAPTITPRTFTRFFTPKSSLEKGGRVGASRQALREITACASNCRGGKTPTNDNRYKVGEDAGSLKEVSKKRKRKIPDPLDITPDRSSPLKRIRNQSLGISEDDGSNTGTVESEDEFEEFLVEKCQSRQRITKRIDAFIGSKYCGELGRELRQESGIHKRTSRPGRMCDGIGGLNDWQYETTSFFTRPEDAQVCMNVEKPSDHTIPFCIASCNTNSLVAIGDQDGGIRLLESGKNEKPGFSKAYLTFRPHTNAILDLAFSPDDLLLATASGDQTSQVIDMPTQRPTYTLAGHVSSVKEVSFQPGSSNILASSSRDGSVQIWDLRCKGFDAPVRDIRVSLETSSGGTTRSSATNKVTWARSVNTMLEAHASRQATQSSAASSSKSQPSFDAPSKTESPGRRGDVSITALSFLGPGRDHLLLTASEANASIKIWDLRTTHNHRRSRATPLSSTQLPDSHNRHRHFGLTSLSLSGNGARLYALCRDNTVYAYLTSHLILGHGPELSSSSSKPRRSGGPEKEGLGPIYGFRHPKFHAATFYIKSAVRSAKDDKSELLAVGSSDGCVVVFPTEERYMQRADRQRANSFDLPFSRTRPTLTRTESGNSLSTRLEDTIPIYQHGSALIRGHSREVTGLTWTPRGEMVTVGDDFTARCWREGSDARDLRTGGEKEGRRWGCGWAEAKEGWDDEGG